MDFDLALFLMLNALKAPNKLYQHTKRLKQIRNHWHRDDPCLTAVIVGAMAVMGIAYTIMAPMVSNEEKQGFIAIHSLFNALKFVLILFLLFGVIMSALCKWIAETFMIKSDKKIASSGGTGGGFSQKAPSSD